VSLPLKRRPEQARGVSLQLLKLLRRRPLLGYPEIETWIDLGPHGKARLIATTKKNAKGESVCSKFSTLGAFGPRVFSFWADPPDAGGLDERLVNRRYRPASALGS
jgi:hypothetical protein